jgi:hypothetical protein
MKNKGYAKKHTYAGRKAILKDWTSGFLPILANFLAPGYGFAFPIRIRIQECKTKRIQILNTEEKILNFDEVIVILVF